MKTALKQSMVTLIAVLVLGAAQAKLPAPPPATEDAKAAAALAAAKAGWGDKVAAFKLCLSQDRTAAHYFKTTKAAGKEVKPPSAAPACADPGPFAAAPPAPAAAEPAKKS